MSDQAPEKRLPKLVEPRKLATAFAHFERVISSEDLPRLSEAAINVDRVWVDINFGRDDQGRPELSGSIEAKLTLECQRCLEAMSYEITRSVALAIVWDEAQAKALPKHIDPWVAGEDEADLAAILEEEILLALPVVARHDYDCLDPSLLSSGDLDQEEDTKPNPFGVLAELKDKH